MKRITLSLPDEVVDMLDYVSRRLGVSRSALVAEVLPELFAPSLSVLQTLPEDRDPTGDDVKRFRGASVALVRERLESFLRLGDDLFSQLPPDSVGHKGRD